MAHRQACGFLFNIAAIGVGQTTHLPLWSRRFRLRSAVVEQALSPAFGPRYDFFRR
jgi:hypothetical protein